MDFNSKEEFWKWKNSEANPYRGFYATGEEETQFNYSIDNITALIENSNLTKKEKGRFEVKEAINFALTIFDKCFNVNDCDFCRDFGLYNNCEFNNRVIIAENKFNQKFDISDSYFNNDKIIPVSIYRNEFLLQANFNNISSNRELIIEKCIFFKKVDFSKCKFHQEIVIKECVFKNEVTFKGTQFINGFSFVENDICGHINFEECVFGGDVKIIHTKGEIHEINFSSSIIKGILELKSSVFLSENSSIKFNNAFIDSNGFLNILNINKKDKFTGEINFTDAKLLGNVVLQNIYLKKFLLTSAVMVGDFFAENLHFKEESDSQTYVRLKDEALKHNNSIKALKYREKEMLAYSKELNAQKSCGHLGTWLIDKFVLFLNTISNKNGLSWLRGIFFTISCAIISFWIINFFGIETDHPRFFVVDLATFHFEGIGEILKRFLNMFYLIDFKEKFQGTELNAIGEIVFFVSKIFISYGIYQTIVAFRKFSK